jgi:hypothetical protein
MPARQLPVLLLLVLLGLSCGGLLLWVLLSDPGVPVPVEAAAPGADPGAQPPSHRPPQPLPPRQPLPTAGPSSAEPGAPAEPDPSPALDVGTGTEEPPGSILGEVLDLQGQPLSGLAVEVVDQGTILTDGEGGFELHEIDPGAYQVCATLPGGLRLCTEALVPAGGEALCRLGGRAQLHVRFQIMGWVPDATGAPAEIEVLRVVEGQLAPLFSVPVGEDGSFGLPELEEGELTFRFAGAYPIRYPRGAGPGPHREVTVDPPRGGISGQVLRTDGGSPGEARVRATRRGEEVRDLRSALAVADTVGRFELTGLPAGVYDIFADLPDDARGTTEEVRLAAGQHLHDVLVEASLGGRLEVLLLDPAGQAVTGGAVWCQDALGFLFPMEETDTPGRFRLEEMGTGGAYRVLAGEAASGLWWAEGVVPRPGETVTLDAALPGRGSRLCFRVTVAGEPAGGALITISTAAGQALPDITSATFVAALAGHRASMDGTLTTTLYPPGTYQAQVIHGTLPARQLLLEVDDTGADLHVPVEL